MTRLNYFEKIFAMVTLVSIAFDLPARWAVGSVWNHQVDTNRPEKEFCLIKQEHSFFHTSEEKIKHFTGKKTEFKFESKFESLLVQHMLHICLTIQNVKLCCFQVTNHMFVLVSCSLRTTMPVP